ncbi:MAG TPA: hypothetical protein VEV19_12510 [Ktedonobacteraceae bacterium]|nr:hypothetical protein [Ktedonobacteraceae bacterium]
MARRISARISLRATSRANNRRQAFVLLILGVVCLLLAWLLHLNPFTDPIGVLVLGICMLVAFVFNPYRLAVASWMMTLIGIEVYFVYKHIIPNNQILGTFLIAEAIALFLVAMMARQGWVKAGAFSPAFIIAVIGVFEYLIIAGTIPFNSLSFPLSLWFPGVVLLLFGLFYLLTSGSYKR